MNKLLAPVLSAVLLVASVPAVMAGGPVIVEDTVEVVADKPASTIGIVPVIVAFVTLCAVLCGNDGPPQKGCAAAIDC